MNRKTLTLLACLAAGIAAFNAETQAQNTTVRFRISHGSTPFGNIDVELFDADKPQTVSNFLAYVRSGAYDNTFLNELVPGVALVGGLGKVANPYVFEPFEFMSRVPEGAPVPNEFSSGTARSNVLGTLSMLKENPENPDSATTRWFFNLGNNNDGVGVTNLDTYLGGHTVFGQVKACSMPVLTYFNGLYEEYGIQNTTNEFHTGSCAQLHRFPDGAYIGFPALPVAFSGLDCVYYSDLFNVQIVILGDGTPDTAPPQVTITSPAPNAELTSLNLQVSVRANDKQGTSLIPATSVRVYLNTNTPVNAVSNTLWTATLPNVPPGTNQIMVEAFDAAGNRTIVSQRFFRSVRTSLTLSAQPFGNGSITGNGAANGAMLEIGRGYTFTATPGPNALFGGWTGTLHSSTRTLSFIMESNMTLTALFPQNRFPQAKGTYNGLFYDTNLVEQQSSGALTFTLGDLGSYSAKLSMNGKTYRFTGAFSPDGTEANFVERPDSTDLLVKMAIDLVNNPDHCSGSVSNFFEATNAWSALLMADRPLSRTPTNASPLAGKFTMLIPADENSAESPTGDGYACVTLSTKDAVKLSGALADGTKIVQKSTVSKDGKWPLYVPLYKGKGALISWINFDTNDVDTDFTGLANWFKQPQTATHYPGGFINETEILGSRFVPPGTNSPIEMTDGIASFTAGNLAEDFSNSVTLNANGTVVNHGDNPLTLTINKSSGLFTGSVTPPGESRAIPFKGVVLQKQDAGAGFFLGTNQSGRVFLGAD